MHLRWWMQCKLDKIYQIQCILYLPDAIQSISTRLSKQLLSTPVDVWCEDQTPPQGREKWVDNNTHNNNTIGDSAERGVCWALSI